MRSKPCPIPRHWRSMYPDVLHNAPFAALHDGSQYLVERYAIRYGSGLRSAEKPDHANLGQPGEAVVFASNRATDKSSQGLCSMQKRRQWGCRFIGKRQHESTTQSRHSVLGTEA